MSVEANKQLSRRWWDEVFNQGNLATVDHLAPAVLSHMHSPGPDREGAEAFKQVVQHLRTAFPDLHITVDDIFGEGDKVVTRWTFTGTHRGEYFGIPSTSKEVMVTGMSVDRFAEGKLVESWNEWDGRGLERQLRSMP